jgi:hypothetical protein
MSINAMTNVALARRTDVAPLDDVPHGTRGIADAASGAATPQSPVTAALAVIVTYLPTEVLTLYVAVLAAIQTPAEPSPRGMWVTFWIFLVATPLVVWLVYAAKVRSDNKPLPLAPAQWPLWEMIAAPLSYMAWALSLPGAPFLAYVGLPTTLGAVIVLVTATLLALLAPIFQHSIKA